MRGSPLGRVETDWAEEKVLRTPDGREIELPRGSRRGLTIGRDLTSDIQLLDAGVSRHHALLTPEASDLWIEDLHSQNGTFVNMERVRRSRLREGDILSLGRLHLTLVTRRRRVEKEADALHRLGVDELARLLRLVRGLGGPDDPRSLPGRALDALLGALELDRGVFFLRDEGRDRFQPVESRFAEEACDSARLAEDLPLAAVLQGWQSQTILRTAPTGGPSGRSVHRPAALVPVHAWHRPFGVIFLSRSTAEEEFPRHDLEFLSAFAWASAGVFGAAGRIEELLSASDDARGFAAALTPENDLLETARISAPVARGTELAGVLSEFERELAATSRRGESDDTSLRRLSLLARASRLLWTEAPTPRRAIRLGGALVEATAHEGRLPWRLEERSLPAVRASAEPLDALLRLIAFALGRSEDPSEPGAHGSAPPPPAPRLRVRAAAGRVRLEFPPGAPPTAAPRRLSDTRREGEPPTPALALDLARRLAASLLEGRLELRADGGLELELPVAMPSPDETVAI